MRTWSIRQGKHYYTLDEIYVRTNAQAFQLACENGHINVAIWLHSLNKENWASDCAFYMACRNGHLNVAVWLHSLGKINHHFDNECAFRTACEYERMDIVAWLYSQGNIHIIHGRERESLFAPRKEWSILSIRSILGLSRKTNDEDIFQWACKNGYLSAARWLHSLDGISADICTTCLEDV